MRKYTQKELGDYLSNNPLNAPIFVGDLDNMNGDDYIFLDYLNERNIPFDNKGIYKTSIQISIYTKKFEHRKTLVDYVKGLSQFTIDYQPSSEGNYFGAIMTTEILM